MLEKTAGQFTGSSIGWSAETNPQNIATANYFYASSRCRGTARGKRRRQIARGKQASMHG